MDKELSKLMNEMGDAFVGFRDKYTKEFGEMKKQVDAIETAVARGQFPGGTRSTRKPS